MKEFMHQFAGQVTGVLSGFDRLVFRGTLRSLCHAGGVVGLMLNRGVRFVDFGRFANGQSETLKKASLQAASDAGRPIRYLSSSRWSKESIARGIAERDRIDEGLICVLTCVEPCFSYELHRDRIAKKARIESRRRKCLFLYHYWMDRDFGFMSARIQTWLPYSIQICINGREWLARQMDRRGIGYRRVENCFPRIDDLAAAQQLADAQRQTEWPATLQAIARRLNPAHEAMLSSRSVYYWSTYQSEWATDVMFGSTRRLQRVAPKLMRTAIVSFGSEQVMRYLRDVELQPTFQRRIVSDSRRREEGVRVKHWVGENSIKMYDKADGVLRVETTINDPKDFKAFRATEGDPHGAKAWRQMRKGVSDLNRRAEVSQAANARYLDALASLEIDQTVGELVDRVCRPTRWKNKRVRALRPWSPEDHALLAAVARGEHAINGLRNGDLRARLHPGNHPPPQNRRFGARITRQLRLLRAHGLIRKIPKTHRYVLTEKGRRITTAVLQIKTIPMKRVMEMAA
jgi:hypothetical protein